MSRPPKWPEPGIYYDIPFPQYLELDAVNSTWLRDIASKTPMHASYFRRFGRKASDAMKLGSAVNHRVLEQGLALDRIAIWRERKSNGHMMPMKGDKWDAFVAANPGRLIVKETTWDEAGFVAAGIRRNSEARTMFATRRGTEVTVLWERDGRLCKARIDILGRDWWITDLKVVGVPLTKRKLAWHAWGYRWDMQAAWYREALVSHDIDCPGCSLLAVESRQPHGCKILDWPEAALDQAETANGDAFEELRACEHDNVWPGYKERELLNDGPWKDDGAGLTMGGVPMFGGEKCM